MRIVKKILFSILVLIILFIAGVLIAVNISPKPISNLIRSSFDNSGKDIVYPRTDDFDDLKSKVDIKKDFQYTSEYSNNKFDLIVPKETDNNAVIFWVHGGAFIGGDKRDNLDYVTMIAASGYTVINIDYALAPEDKYPTPVKQLSEVVDYVKSKADEYKIDITKVFIAGDSAGAQISGQFVNSQVNKDYQKNLGIKKVLDKNQIKGYISFSGLLDVKKYNETESKISNFLYNKSAWAYFGTPKWKSEVAKEASVTGNLTKDFPAVYLTDGNKDSFLEQAQAFEKELKDLNIPVELTTFPIEENELLHEYQFNMDLKEAKVNYEKVLEFLKKYSK